MRCFEVILGLEEGDFGSKNETRGGMEGGIVEKRADGLGVFQTLSIYVKYPPCLYRRFSPFSAVFLLFSSYLVSRLALFYLSCQSLRLSLVCLALLSAILAETNKLFQLSFKYFHIFHCNILYFLYHHLLILHPYTFPLSITFPYTTLFPFYLHRSFYHLLFYPSCTLLQPSMLSYMFYWYNHARILLSIQYNSLRRVPAIIIIFSIDFLYMFSFCVSLFSYTSFCLLYTVLV